MASRVQTGKIRNLHQYSREKVVERERQGLELSYELGNMARGSAAVAHTCTVRTVH